MPVAHAGETKYAYLDHDTDVVNEAPPILNLWYMVFDAEDVRLLWCVVNQINDEHVVKNVAVRWTIDGNVYYNSDTLGDNNPVWVYRSEEPSSGGTSGLYMVTSEQNAAFYVDKRGHSFKVEVRITTAPGTNQTLTCYCVRETLEQT
jgi:hypothetical protein